jgi:hypothetical protein
MSTSFGELPDFLSAALKLSTVLYKVDQGYHVQSDIRRKTQLHENMSQQCVLPIEEHILDTNSGKQLS